MFADFFHCFFFSFIKDDFVFFEQVSSFCIDGYDQRSEFFHTAVPQCFRHSQISPLCVHDLLDFCCCNDCITRREYTVNCFVVLAGILRIRTHSHLFR